MLGSPHENMLVWIVVAALLLLLVLFSRHPHFIQDVRHVRHKLKVRRQVEERYKRNYLTLDRFLEVVETQPHKLFIRFKDENYTYRDADELSSKAARVFLQSGRVKQGDKVALFLGNKPIFLFLWLGLLKIGCPVAFLNHNVRSKSLLHCFHCCGAKTLVADEESGDKLHSCDPWCPLVDTGTGPHCQRHTGCVCKGKDSMTCPKGQVPFMGFRQTKGPPPFLQL